MTNSKIEVTVGAVVFSGEGEASWLAEQLDKVLKAAPEIADVQSKPRGEQISNGGPDSQGKFSSTLASYIKEKDGGDSQVDRFLITADWLRRRGTKLTTRVVTDALRDNHQKKLANPAHCLNQNVSKGYCEKTTDGFFITPDGLAKLGHS